MVSARQGLDPPLVVHVIHELGIGGLENGLINLVNRMPAARYRHAIVCMTRYTDFRARIARDDVEVIAINRGDAPLWWTYLKLVRVLRRLRPAIVHSRNLSGLDALLPAFCAGIPVRVHGEHGRDADDLDGTNPKYQRLRKLFKPLVVHYTTVSRDLERYLVERIGVSRNRIRQIYNGVDTQSFFPRMHARDESCFGAPGTSEVLIGTVGRLQAVKDQVTLVKAFAEASRIEPGVMAAARLVIVGEGPCRAQIEAQIERSGIGSRIHMAGKRDDIAKVMRCLDLFVLPSLSEGISNTILEAMSTGLPILATRVGGNPELIADGEVGQLVEAGDWQAMAQWLVRYAGDGELRSRQGRAARLRAEEQFSIDSMVQGYLDLYDALLGIPTRAPHSAGDRSARLRAPDTDRHPVRN